MNNTYYVKISCGAYKGPALNALQSGMNADKEFQISGDISIADVQSMASVIATSTYSKKLERIAAKMERNMSDGVANAFIYLNGNVIAGVSISFEGEKPRVEYLDNEAINNLSSPSYPGMH